MHVDMDAFYASVELIDRPDLRGKPVIIGHDALRSVVVTATYEARAFGIRAGMPMTVAKRKAPHAAIVEPHHQRYAEVSRGIMAVFDSITPHVEPISLDEAFLDVRGAVRRLGQPLDIAHHIKDTIRREQKITCSVGMAPVKFVAKMASDYRKPDGIVLVRSRDILRFLHPQPVQRLWGVGPKTAEQLIGLGLTTIGHVAATPKRTLTQAFGQATGSHLHDLSHGQDPRQVQARAQEQSISAEQTYAEDLTSEPEIHRELLRLAERTTARLRDNHTVARAVTIKVRLATFKTLNRSRTLDHTTDTTQDVYEIAKELWQKLDLYGYRVRLLGVKCDQLYDVKNHFSQPQLGDRNVGRREAEHTVDAIRAKFGKNIVQPGTLVSRDTSTTRHPHHQ